MALCVVSNCHYAIVPGSSFCLEHQPGKYAPPFPPDSAKDMVNHPPHYNVGKYEVIDIIEDTTDEGFEYYLQGNIMKYLMRYRHKRNPLEDLKKSRWYLDKLISIYEKHEIK